MITEDYVSFETAKLLKEKGFDCSSYNHYRLDNGELCRFNTNCSTNIEPNNYITAPTLQLAMKWLREIKEVFIAIGFCDYPSLHKTEWIPEISTHDSVFPDSAIAYGTYEKACEEAIKYCLNNLI